MAGRLTRRKWNSMISWHSSATLTQVFFPCFFLSCKANVRLKPAKTGHGPHSSKILVLFYVLFVLCLCVLMCTVPLPPSDYPIAVNKYINTNINNSLQEIRSVDFVTCAELLRKDEQVETNYVMKSFTTHSSSLISVKIK